MFNTKTTLYRLTSRAESLEGKTLLGGFEEFQDWKGEVHEFFQGLAAEFDQLTQTPVGIQAGVRFLEKTFKD